MAKDFNIPMPIVSYEVKRGMDPRDPTRTEGDYLVLTGWASDASVDKLGGQFTPECINMMVETVNTKVYRNMRDLRADTKPVTVDVEHSFDWDKQLGFVARAEAINEIPAELRDKGIVPPVMAVELWLDMEMSGTKDLKRSLDKGAELGLSVFAKIPPGGVKLVRRGEGSARERFEKVELLSIAITGKPVNPNTWVDVVKRSLDEGDIEETVEQEVAPVEAAAPAETVEAAAPVPVAQDVTETEPEAAPVVGTQEAEATVARSVTEASGQPVTPAPTAVTAEDEGLSPEALADIATLTGGTVPGIVARAEAAPAPEKEAVQPAPVDDLEASILADIAQTEGEAEPPVITPAPVAAVEPPVAPTPAPAPSASVAPVETTPAPVQAPTANEVEETVARAEGYVSRAEMHQQFSQVRAILEPLPGFLETTTNEVTELRRSLAERDAKIAKLEQQMTDFLASPVGRRGQVWRGAPPIEGDSVTRSEGAQPKPLLAGLPHDVQIKIQSSLRDAGHGDVATALALGMITTDDVDPAILDPLLPKMR